MSALLRKEIRMIAPSFAVAALLVVALVWSPQGLGQFRDPWIVLQIILAPIAVLVVALDPFGREMSGRTFSGLLSLPIPRASIWRVKCLVSGGAMGALLLGWIMAARFNGRLGSMMGGNMEFFQLTSVMVVLCAYSGGLWAVLFTRQTAAAFWLAAICPLLLVLGLNRALGNTVQDLTPFVAGTLAIYAAAGWFLARRLFLNAQDLEPSLRNPSLLLTPVEKPGSSSGACQRSRWPLVRKELRMHRALILFGALLAVIHVGVVIMRSVMGSWVPGPLDRTYPVLAMGLDAFWLIWLIMPLLIGVSAIAEERRHHVWEAQLCLGASRSRQMFAKVAVASLLAWVLGACAPVLIEGNAVLGSLRASLVENPWSSDNHGLLGMMVSLDSLLTQVLPFQAFPLLFMTGVTGGILLAALTASSMTRSALQAMSPAILGILLGAIGIGLTQPGVHVFDDPFWNGNLGIWTILMPVAALACIRVWRNSQQALTGTALWRRNALVLLGIPLLVLPLLTTAIYHRWWEIWAAEAQPSQDSFLPGPDKVGIRSHTFAGALTVLLADGRCWWGSSLNPQADDFRFPRIHGDAAITTQGWLPGDGWVSVECTSWEIVGIKSNGTLWISQPGKERGKLGDRPPDPRNMVQHGADADWQAATARASSFQLLKRDGSLWEWRRAEHPQDPHELGSIQDFKPHRLSESGIWKDLRSVSSYRFLMHSNGTLYSPDWPYWNHSDTNFLQVSKTLTARPMHLITNTAWTTLGVVFTPAIGGTYIGVSSEKEFVVMATWQRLSKAGNYSLRADRVPISDERVWVSVLADANKALTLREDGTLWQWRFPSDPAENPGSATASRFSRRGDWAGIANHLNGFVGLARDGSLWSWNRLDPANPNTRTRTSERLGFLPVLGPSRVPARLGNLEKPPGTR